LERVGLIAESELPAQMVRMCDFDFEIGLLVSRAKAFQVRVKIRKARANFEVSLLTLELKTKHIVLRA